MLSVQAMYPGSYSCIHVVTSHFCPKDIKIHNIFTHLKLSVLVYGANHMVAKSNSLKETYIIHNNLLLSQSVSLNVTCRMGTNVFRKETLGY
jgi:hypothetical protein